MKVRAKESCIYGKVLRRQGDTFNYTGEADKLPSWMERMDNVAEAPAPKDEDERVETDEQRKARIMQALAKLDHNDDDHWTPKGSPAIAAVRVFFDGDIEAAEVRAAAPEFQREKPE